VKEESAQCWKSRSHQGESEKFLNGQKMHYPNRQWLAETLGIEATYHAVYQMTRYRLKSKLKVVRPQNKKQNREQRESFKKN